MAGSDVTIRARAGVNFRLPDADDLRRVAAALGHELDADTARMLAPFAAGMSESYRLLEQMDDALPRSGFQQRSFRYPDPAENPHGAWFVLTDLPGRPEGALRGRSIAIKDNIFIAAVPMMNGADFLRGFTPDFDATVVTRVLEAGAHIKGKSVCEFLCVSGGSATAGTGVVTNPRKAGFSAGGSSSGSAALVAAGGVDMALGCDQAGSIRIPSSWCGTCGMKPTHGLVPYTGIAGMEATLDYVGPITAGVADNALLLQVLAGDDGLDGRQRQPRVQPYTEALARDVGGMRIALVREGFGQTLSEADVDECVRGAAHRLLRLGARVEEVSIPLHVGGVGIWAGVINDGLRHTLLAGGAPVNVEGLCSPAFAAALSGWQAGLEGFPANALLLILLGKYMEQYGGYYYARARNLVRRLRRAYDEVLEQHDLLLLPTTLMKALPNPGADPAQGDGLERLMSAAFNTILNTCQFDVSGHPAMSLPCGMRDGLPVGVMLVGRHYDEMSIYRAAHCLEQSGDWKSW